MTELAVLDTTIQKTHEWLKDITMGWVFPTRDRHSPHYGQFCIRCAIDCHRQTQRSSEPSSQF